MIMHIGAYYEDGGEPNVSEIKCNAKRGKWAKQKKRASCLPYVLILTFIRIGKYHSKHVVHMICGSSSNFLFRSCDPRTLNLPDGVTWKSKTSKNAIIFKFFCPGNKGYSTVKGVLCSNFFGMILGSSKENKMQK